MLRRILVLIGPHTGVDDAGLARACTLAERGGASIELLDIVYDPHLAGYLGHAEVYESLRERVLAERHERAQSLARELDARGVTSEVNTQWASPAHIAVAREAAAADVDLVVFAPADPNGLSPDEWRLVSICPAPVLVVRRSADAPYATIVAAVDPRRTHDKPAGLDHRILEHAEAMRQVFDARVEVLTCIPPLAPLITHASAMGALRDAESVIRKDRERELEALVRDAGLAPDTAMIVDGRPDDVLGERSASDERALIVLGSVSRGPIARLLIGSTAARVLRGAGGDVLVVKPPGLGFAPDAQS
jgi:universal stress protein E